MDAERVAALTGEEQSGLIDALLYAFVGRDEFDMLLTLKLDKPPGTFPDSGGLKACLFKLIRTAKSEGWLPDLIEAAVEERPNNLKLRAWMESVGLTAVEQAPSPAPAIMSAYPDLEYVIEQQPWYSGTLPQAEEIGFERIRELRPQIDVVLITATEIELLAVLSKLQPLPRRRKVSLVYEGPETYYLGRFGACFAVVTKCRMGALGDGSVILATDQAQRLWLPRAIIMIGLAFGKDRNKQRIADVIVASQIVSYEQQRIGAEIAFRGPIAPVNGALLNRFENAADWRFERPDKTSCTLIVGPVLSGEKLIDEPAFKKALFDRFPQAVGGEMEGAGLCAATGRIGTAWILVKAICDWADGRKESSQQPLAAAAATSLVLHILSRRTALRAIEKPKLSQG